MAPLGEDRRMIKRSSYLAVAALLTVITLAAPPADASYVVTFVEKDSNVLETGRGTLDLTDLTRASPITSGAFIAPSDAIFQSGADGQSIGFFYGNVYGPHRLGAGDPISATLSAGSPVGIDAASSPEFVLVSPDYRSGSPLSESSVYLNATFASLELTPGVYVWDWGSGDHADTFTINVVATGVADSVPESSTWAMMLLGFAGIGYVAVRRKPVFLELRFSALCSLYRGLSRHPPARIPKTT
jgi:hypothetical protein